MSEANSSPGVKPGVPNWGQTPASRILACQGRTPITQLLACQGRTPVTHVRAVPHPLVCPEKATVSEANSSPPVKAERPETEPLRNDPRFRALVDEMRADLDRQRSALERDGLAIAE